MITVGSIGKLVVGMTLTYEHIMDISNGVLASLAEPRSCGMWHGSNHFTVMNVGIKGLH